MDFDTLCEKQAGDQSSRNSYPGLFFLTNEQLKAGDDFLLVVSQ